jgi:predicted metal-dependent enzyme (double-stranded beta helix superfamily)
MRIRGLCDQSHGRATPARVEPCMTSSALTSFVSDAERLLDDPHAIGARLGALLAHDGWLAPEHRVPDRDHYRQHLLHVSPSRRMSIVALVWLPGQRTAIHDHVSWCVVGVYEGLERETRYRAVESGAERCLEPTGSIDAHPGHVEVIVPSVEDIHAVTAVGEGPTISIHVYGADIERLGSSIYRRFDDWPVREGLSAAA